MRNGIAEKLSQVSKFYDGFITHAGDKYVTIVTSQDPTLRGCQLSLQFSWPIEDVHTFLKRRGVVVSH